MASKFKFTEHTASEWASLTPAKNEYCIATETKTTLYKIGNGSYTYANLPFRSFEDFKNVNTNLPNIAKRETLKRLKDHIDVIDSLGVGGGTAQAQTITYTQDIVLTVGKQFTYTPSVSNTATAPTININGLGAKTVILGTNVASGTALIASDITINVPCIIIYDGINFRLQNPQNTPAASVKVTPTGGIVATNVQTALAEIDGEVSELELELSLLGSTERSNNFFNRIVSHVNGFITSNGSITVEGSYATYLTSDFIELSPNNYAIYSSYSLINRRIPVCIFDSAKNVIGYVYNGSVLKELFTLNSIGYIRFSVSSLNIWNKVMIVNGTEIIPYEEYSDITTLKEDVVIPQLNIAVEELTILAKDGNNINAGSVPLSKIQESQLKGNIKSFGVLESGVYYRNNNGVKIQITNVSYYAITLPVDKNTDYAFTFGRFVLLLAENGTTVIGNTEYANITTINSGEASFISVSFAPSGYTIDDYVISVGTALNSDDYNYLIPYISVDEYGRLSDILDRLRISNKLFSKKYVATGDSYTAWSDATYPDGPYIGQEVTYDREVRLRNEMIGYNEAESGSTMALAKASEPTKAAVDAEAFSNLRYLTIPSDTDYLTLAFGINDSTFCDLGTIADTENTTFYGAWNKVLTYFATNIPAMKIGIIIFQRNNNTFYEAIKIIAEYHGIPYIDFYGGTDTPMYVDGKAFSVDANLKAIRKAYFCGHNAEEDPSETFQGRTVIVKADGENLTHPGYRSHVDESSIIEYFLRRL